MNAATLVLGRAAICALGPTLAQARAALLQPPRSPSWLTLDAGGGALRVPVRRLSEAPPSPVAGLTAAGAWEHHWFAQVRQVLDDAGAPRDGALVVASSSFEMGALEIGGRWSDDGLSWVEALARAADWEGPVMAVNTACTASFNALRLARDWLEAEPTRTRATVLGLEALSHYALAGFASLQLVGEDQPLVLAEAVAAVVLGREGPGLESSPWRLSGTGHRVCGTDPGAADAQALSSAIDEALEDAGRRSQDIDQILGHSTGQARNDATEAAVFDARLPTVPRQAYKAWLGHTQGACSVLELALWMDQFEAGETAWPSSQPHAVLALAVGFGGGHGALVLEHRPSPCPDHRPDGVVPASARTDPTPAASWVRHEVDPGTDPSESLARRLGRRPRRLGPWAERALWGARCCLDAAGLAALPAGARLAVLSYSGPVASLELGLRALAEDGAPLPYTFLQSQPAVMLAGLGAHLGWQGDALCLALRAPGPSPANPDHLAWLCKPYSGLLLGWVDERPRTVSRWVWIPPAPPGPSSP